MEPRHVRQQRRLALRARRRCPSALHPTQHPHPHTLAEWVETCGGLPVLIALAGRKQDVRESVLGDGDSNYTPRHPERLVALHKIGHEPHSDPSYR